MGASMSIAVAGAAAAYVGIIDLTTLQTDAAMAFFKMALMWSRDSHCTSAMVNSASEDAFLNAAAEGWLG